MPLEDAVRETLARFDLALEFRGTGEMSVIATLRDKKTHAGIIMGIGDTAEVAIRRAVRGYDSGEAARPEPKPDEVVAYYCLCPKCKTAFETSGPAKEPMPS